MIAIDLAGLRHDARVGGEDAVDVGVDLADVGAEGSGEGDGRGVGSAAAERGDVARLAVEALEAGDDGDGALVERLAEPAGGDVDDARGAVLGIRDHAGLAAGEGAGVVAEAADGHGEQRHRDALAGGEQHVELAGRRDRRDLVGEVEQVVGGVAHGADGDDDLVARLAVSTMRLATRLMLSASATEEPPNFCTIKLTNNSWGGRGGTPIINGAHMPSALCDGDGAGCGCRVATCSGRVRRMDTMLEGWTEFNLAIAGAGAALAGLIIVAMSVNIREILQTATIPARAAASIGALMLGVTASCLALIPRQPLWALGLEILVGTAVATWLELTAARAIVRENRANGSPLLEERRRDRATGRLRRRLRPSSPRRRRRLLRRGHRQHPRHPLGSAAVVDRAGGDPAVAQLTERRPSKARPRVTSSAYSRSPPTGSPDASRVTRISSVVSRRDR